MSQPPPLPQAIGQVSIECEVTKDDLVAFNQYHNLLSVGVSICGRCSDSPRSGCSCLL